MSCTLSHECRVMLSSLLTASTDVTRVWRAEMDRTVDPMLHSIFNRLKTKLTNGLERTQSAGDCAQVENSCLHDPSVNTQIYQPSTTSSLNPTSTLFNPQFINMNYSYQPQKDTNHLGFISNQQVCSLSQPMTIKKEVEPMPTEQSPSFAPVLYEQSNHNLTNQHLNNEHLHSSEINCADGQGTSNMGGDTARVKVKEEFDETTNELIITSLAQSLSSLAISNEESSNNLIYQNWKNAKCVDGGIEVKGEDGENQEDVKLFLKRPRLDTTQLNKAQAEVTRQSTGHRTDDEQSNGDDEGDRMGSEQSQAIDTRATIEHYDHGQYNSDESIVIQQEERDANNAIGEESIATECTTNPIQPNLVQPNRHLQCSHCLKSFDYKSMLQKHLRVHTGERPFECDQCDKRFSQAAILTQHQLIHQNIKNYRCTQCDKQFNRKDLLDSHLRTHSGERPFECRHCDQSFTQLITRTKHEQAIHLHVKPYRCKQCAHTATQRSDLIKHIRTVHFGLPKSIKQQRALNIVDDRDPRELIEKV